MDKFLFFLSLLLGMATIIISGCSETPASKVEECMKAFHSGDAVEINEHFTPETASLLSKQKLDVVRDGCAVKEITLIAMTLPQDVKYAYEVQHVANGVAKIDVMHLHERDGELLCAFKM